MADPGRGRRGGLRACQRMRRLARRSASPRRRPRWSARPAPISELLFGLRASVESFAMPLAPVLPASVE
eukprot:1654204-Alexandrium_andersonii.AAC.1